MVSVEKYQQQVAKLDLQAMMEDARQTTGLTDFGADRFKAPLTRYLDNVAREVQFKPAGLDTLRSSITGQLVNRLRIEDDLRRHPEILEEEVSAPIVILGLPRSGTTKMQRMLSAAPDVQRLYLWRMMNPAPFPDAEPGGVDPRIEALRLGLGIGSESMESNAEVMAGHEMTATLVDEDTFLFDYALDHSIAGVGPYAPYFTSDEWAAGDPERESDLEGYRYSRTVLQYLQWQDGGARGRPWVLKAIPHLGHLDALLACYPDATLIHTHRDPRSSVPSVAKVMYSFYDVTAVVDKDFIGEAMLRWCRNLAVRALDARERLRLDSRIYDVRYEDVRTDAMSVIREVYRRAGRDLTPDAEKAMLGWEQDNEQGKRGAHSYSLEEFGLDDARVNSELEEYVERFSALF
jgi:hypothetical protein